MKTKYKQCGLCLSIKDRSISQVSWIPSKYAILNAVLRLKDPNTNMWEDGWVVTTVGDEIDQDDVPDWHRARKVHRERTGDSLKRNE